MAGERAAGSQFSSWSRELKSRLRNDKHSTNGVYAGRSVIIKELKQSSPASTHCMSQFSQEIPCHHITKQGGDGGYQISLFAHGRYKLSADLYNGTATRSDLEFDNIRFSRTFYAHKQHSKQRTHNSEPLPRIHNR